MRAMQTGSVLFPQDPQSYIYDNALKNGKVPAVVVSGSYHKVFNRLMLLKSWSNMEMPGSFPLVIIRQNGHFFWD